MATQKSNTGDIQDLPKDQEKLKNENATINLPDVEDIPGQENIQVPHIKEMSDTTASSSDEEGDDIFNEEDVTDEDFNVSNEERELLQRSAESMSSEDDESVRQASLDDIDDEGEPLNESVGLSGEDLDVPGAEDDDENEEIGEEDEENNSYSIGGENSDN